MDAAREVIAQGVSDVFTAANIESLPSASIKSWCETWTEAKAIETEESTHARYKRVIERFTGFLGEAKSKRDLSTLQASDVARFRDREAKELSRSTANLGVKVLRICVGEAVRQGLLAVNPAVRVKLLKSTAESKRRAFTLDEIKRILRACDDDTEWRGLVLFGLYLGQRLGDLAKLTWRGRSGYRRGCVHGAQDWPTNRAPAGATARRLLGVTGSERRPERFHFPSRSEREAHGIVVESVPRFLVAVGLVEQRPRGHKSTGKGRDQAREASEISFHSLRHSAVTMLKAAGVSDFIAREIVRHESAAVSCQYTHLTTDDKRAAMRRLPDVTNG